MKPKRRLATIITVIAAALTLVARGGWTEAAHAFAREMSESVTKDGNWETVGMRLLDLDQADQDLAAWSF